MSQEEEYDLKYKLPLFRRSTKAIQVTDKRNSEVGVIQKYFSNFADRLLDQYATLVNKTNYRVSTLEDESLYEVVICNFKETMWRNKWILRKNGENIGKLVDRTKIKTNPYFNYTTADKEYVVKSDFLDKNTLILDKSGKTMVRVFYKNVLNIRDVYIKVYSNNQLSREEVLLLSILSFTSSD